MGNNCTARKQRIDLPITGERYEMLTWEHLQDLDREADRVWLAAQARVPQVAPQCVASLVAGIATRLGTSRLYRSVLRRAAYAKTD